MVAYPYGLSTSKYQSWCLCRLHRSKLSRLEGFCYLIHSNQSSILLVSRSWFNTIPRKIFSPSENPHRTSLESPLWAPRSYIFKCFKQVAVYLCMQNYQQVSRSSHQSPWPFQSCKQRHLRPVRPASPWGPPMMNLPEGLMCKCLQRKTLYRWRAKGKEHMSWEKLLASNTTSAKRTSTICNKKASRNLHFMTHILRKARGGFSWMQWYESPEGVARAFPNFTHAPMMKWWVTIVPSTVSINSVLAQCLWYMTKCRIVYIYCAWTMMLLTIPANTLKRKVEL